MTPLRSRSEAAEASKSAVPYGRAALGGALMGLANLVPGISGGTMLLAAGIYSEFIEAVAAITRLRLERAALLLVLAVVSSGALAIALFAGPVKDLVVEQRWLAYSVFVGLTLGGIPALWRLAQPITNGVWGGIATGFVAMSMLGLAQQSGMSAVGLTGSGVPALVIAADPEVGSLVSKAKARELAQIADPIDLVRISGAGHSMHRDAFATYMETLRGFLGV